MEGSEMTGLEIAGALLIGSLIFPVIALAGYGVVQVGTGIVTTVADVLTYPFT
jgi:hypothetical protein|tara:strand:+ start:71 stop:229 length:159 start_codon:yes stop_codon:yes gene_type:complete